jgi:single-stranded DNA-binding protein
VTSAPVNQVSFIGNLVADPKSSVTSGGKTVTYGRLAVTRKGTDGQALPKGEGLYISLAAYTSTAQALAACTAKDRIQVQGRLDLPEVYQGSDGSYHAGLRMTAFSLVK